MRLRDPPRVTCPFSPTLSLLRYLFRKVQLILIIFTTKEMPKNLRAGTVSQDCVFLAYLKQKLQS